MGTYTQEKKDQVIKEVEEVKSISAVSRKYNIATTTIHGWIKKENKQIDFQLKPKNKVDHKNIKKLKKELEDKDVEIAILKELLKKTTHVLIKD